MKKRLRHIAFLFLATILFVFSTSPAHANGYNVSFKVQKDGSPLPGVDVLIYSDINQPPEIRGVTGEDGTVVDSGSTSFTLPAGSYTAFIISPAENTAIVKETSVSSNGVISIDITGEWASTVALTVTATKLDSEEALDGSLNISISKAWPEPIGSLSGGTIYAQATPYTYYYLGLWSYSDRYYLYQTALSVPQEGYTLNFTTTSSNSSVITLNLDGFDNAWFIPSLEEPAVWSAPCLDIAYTPTINNSVVMTPGTYSIKANLKKEGWEFESKIADHQSFSAGSYTKTAGGTFNIFSFQAEGTNYTPGDTVNFTFDIHDGYGNSVWWSRRPGSSVPETNYPVLTIQAPGGAEIYSASTTSFTNTSFTMSATAQAGRYTAILTFDTGPHQGPISKAAVFQVGFVDTDCDGMDDSWETANFGDLSHTGTADTDSDDLNDLEEFQSCTDPNHPDTDRDGFTDGQEIGDGSDPNDPHSYVIPAGTYYVDPAGTDDGLHGVSPASSAWKTLHYAIDHINAGNPGTYTLNVALGTYSVENNEPDEALLIMQDNVSIVGASGSRPVLDGSGTENWGVGIETSGYGITIENLEIKGFYSDGILVGGGQTIIRDCDVHDNETGIAVEEASSSTQIEGSSVHDNSFDGISLMDTDDVLIENCDISNNGESACGGGYGVGIYAKEASEVLIRLNRIYSNSSCGIAVEDCSPLIERNEIYDNGWSGVDMWANTQDASPQIWNNLIYSNLDGSTYRGQSGITMSAWGGATKPQIFHNTIDGGTSDGIYCHGLEAAPEIRYNIITNFANNGIYNDTDEPGNPIIDYNDVWHNGPSEPYDQNYNGCSAGPNDISADPLYGSYVLQPNSPCIDAIPIDASDPVFQDYEGNPRPCGAGFDMGAYEYEGAGAATISGTVTAAGSPVSGVSVHAWCEEFDYGIHVLADPAGNYTISGLLPGCYHLNAFPPEESNYVISSQKYVCLGPGEEKTGLHFDLQSGALTVSGTVRADGSPVSGVHVHFWNRYFEVWQDAETDENGGYTLTNLPAGEAGIEVAPYGTYGCTYAGTGTDIDNLTSDVTGLDFDLVAGAQITGRVVDESGNGLADVKVGYWSERYNAYRSTLTDESGNYVLCGLPAGIGNIQARPVPESCYCRSQDYLISLSQGESKEIPAITLKKGARATGTVVNPSGQGLAGVKVESEGVDFFAEAHTDSNGSYQMLLPAGTHKIYLDVYDTHWNLSARPVEVTVTVSQAESCSPISVSPVVAYDEETGGSVSGNVVNEGSAAYIGELQVVALPAGALSDLTAESMWAIRPLNEIELGDFGQFSLGPLPPGGYDIAFVLDNHTDEDLESVTLVDAIKNANVTGGQPTTLSRNLTYTSVGSPQVTGIVKDEDGKPVLGAIVLVRDQNSDLGGFADTDESGNYTLYNLPSGVTYTAEAFHNEYTYTTSVSFTTAEDTNATVPNITLGNLPPLAITSSPVIAAAEDQPYAYTVTANRTCVTFTLSGNPDNMTIDPNSGVISYLPSTDTEAGSYAITVTARDEAGHEATQNFTLTVSAVNDKPTLEISTYPVPYYAMPGHAYILGLFGEDEETPYDLTFELVPGSYPEGMSISQEECASEIRWMPAKSDAGRTISGIQARVIDGAGLSSDPVSFNIRVLNPLVINPDGQVLIRINGEDFDQDFFVSGGLPHSSTPYYSYELINAETEGIEDSGIIPEDAEGKFRYTFSTVDRTGTYRLKVTDGAGFSAVSAPIGIEDVAVEPITMDNPAPVIPAEGGVRSVKDESTDYDGAVINIPAGCSEAASFTLTFKLVTEGVPYIPPETAFGDVIEIKAGAAGEDISFLKPLQVTLPYGNISGIDRPENLRVYTFDTDAGRWVPVAGYTVDTANKTISFSVYHFSLFTVGQAEELKTDIKGGSEQKDYRMLSFPCNPDEPDLVSNLKATLGAYDDTLWRCFAYNSSSMKYDEANSPGFSNTYPLQPGRAYWLISRNDKTLKVNGLSTDSSAPFETTLHPGWNMVANPYNSAIDLSNTYIRVSADGVSFEDISGTYLTDNYLYKFDPHKDAEGNTIWYSKMFLDGESMQPYEGYWLYSYSPSDLILRFTPKHIGLNQVGKPPLFDRMIWLARRSLHRVIDAVSATCLASSGGNQPPPPPGSPGSSPESIGTASSAGGGGGCFIDTAARGFWFSKRAAFPRGR